MNRDLGLVGTVARFKPVHKVHASILEILCEKADHLYIGMGSSNRYDCRNPFTVRESKGMIDVVLKDNYNNYSFIEVPDLWDGPKWKEQILRLFGKLDYFVTANPYVESLLKDNYKIIHPYEILPEDKKVMISGTLVRIAMAKSEPWEHLVPDAVVKYLNDNHIIKRFCREFGLETIARNADEILVGDVV